MRILIITGKGGVGKTSIAAATAVRASRSGKKTLVMSTDAAHSLADAFGRELSNEPVRIAKNLWGQEIDARHELERNWGHIRSLIRTNLQSRGIDSVLAEEVSIFPGMDELFSLLLLKDHYQKGDYGVIVIDCAPTASTIRKLSFPEVGNWYLRRIFPVHKAVARVARPVVKKLCDVTLPDQKAFESIKSLIQSFDGMKEILTDPQQTTIRLVVNLEKMVIKEAQRAYTYLNVFGYSVDAVFVNKVLPETVTDGYFDRWKRLHKKYLGEVKASFPALPIFKCKLFEREMVGTAALGQMADHIFDKQDPTDVFCDRRPMNIERKSGNYLLRWYLPSLTKEKIDLFTRGPELILQTPSCSRNMVMPQVLVGKKIKEAEMKEQELLITFTA